MRKLLYFTGIILLGDAVGYLIGRDRYVRFWKRRSLPEPINRMVRWTGKHPKEAKRVAIGEAAAGIMLLRTAQS